MEQSAFEAVMTGVNVFILVLALTAGVALMVNVIQMVDYANIAASVGMNGTIAEEIGIVDERTYTASQVLSIYNNSEKNLNKGLNITVKINNTTNTLKGYVENGILKLNWNKTYLLNCINETTYQFVVQ